jgi:4,5-dihydroxyphthalate decarboxylase
MQQGKPAGAGEEFMAKLQLSFACGLYDRMQPLYTGEVKVEGIDLNFIVIEQPRPIFDRMAGGEEFDVAEFSSSEFVQRFVNKQCPFVAIPIFPSRAFRHGFIAIHRKAGIRTPKDLEGRTVGVPLLTMTAAIYINGLLQHEYGVDLRKIRWVQGAMNSAGAHGSPTVLPLLDPITVEQNRSDKSLSDLLEERAVDATLGTSLPDAIRTNPDIVRLFPDYVQLEKEYYRRTRIYPIMHLIAIRKQVHERYPFVATSLYNAFCEAKRVALEKMLNLRALRYMTPWLMRDIDEIYEVFGGDPWPYGLEPNRPTLDAFVTYLQEQSLIAAPVAVEDLFVPTY